MFFLRSKSRNNMNEIRNKKNFRAMFFKVFGFNIPHLDTCNNVLERIPPDELRVIQKDIVTYLIKSKFFFSSKIAGTVSFVFDGTGLGTIDIDDDMLVPKDRENSLDKNSLLQEGPINKSIVEDIKKNATIWATGKTSKLQEGPINKSIVEDIKKNATIWATGKTSKNGIQFFTRQMVMIRAIGPNESAVVIDWEPINTEDGSLKEDCEQNATKRLLERVRRNFSRLPITIIADGLFANQSFMKLANDLNYTYIFTLKNESLKNLWKEIHRIIKDLSTDKPQQLIKAHYEKLYKEIEVMKKNAPTEKFFREYEWINGLQHQGHELSWCALSEYVNEDQKFYFSIITNLSPDKSNIEQILGAARSRATIEDGFNTMKNRDVEIKHRFSRYSDEAAMNYITLASVADTLSHLVFSSDFVQRTYFHSDKSTIKNLIDNVKGSLQGYINCDYMELLRQHIPQKVTYTKPLII